MTGGNGPFPMKELVRRSATPAATIHHYLRRGLLPSPRRIAANRFLYDRRHLAALRVIRALRRRRNLPLPLIRRVLPELLAVDETEAFRTETLDRVIGRTAATGPRRSPEARLLSSAMKAFAKRGYGGVNVDGLCRSAGIAKGTFYRHYRSKEELFLAAADAARCEVVAEFAASMADQRAHRSPSDALAVALQSRLPIFMDLFTRAVQRRPGYPPAARRIFSALAKEVGEQLGSEQPVAAGALTLALAAGGIFRSALEPSPLADLANLAFIGVADLTPPSPWSSKQQAERGGHPSSSPGVESSSGGSGATGYGGGRGP